MNTTAVLATSLAFAALSAGTAKAQATCSASPAVIDSARAEAVSILYSDRPLVAELRREQGLPSSAGQIRVSVVRDGSVCQRLASQFDHTHAPGSKFAVLRVGSIFYARDPDQRHATGIFADSTFHVVMRLGAAVDK